MACFSCSNAKKGCVFNECISSCNCCIHLGRLCIPRVPQHTNKYSGANLSNLNPPIPNELPNNRNKSTPCGITYCVDCHVAVLCRRSSTDIGMNPTRRSLNNFPLPPTPSTNQSTVWVIGGHPLGSTLKSQGNERGNSLRKKIRNVLSTCACLTYQP